MDPTQNKPAEGDLDGLPRPGDVIGGKYEVEGVIGLGGMGAVLAGSHMHLQQPVAIKVLLPAFVKNPDVRSRFLREARAAARLRSDHVTRTYDVGVSDDGLPFMVMERLEGVDLAQALEVEGPFRVERAVGFVLQACEAVAEAHALGIVHRDIKPGNLFLANKPNGSAVIKVLDFGISKSLDEVGRMGSGVTDLTGPHSLLGSPHYMSPEQIRDSREVDTRSDVWTLGVLLYELLTKQVPFDAASLPHLYAVVLSDDPVPPARHGVTLPPGLEQVLFDCLRKSREERIQDVSTLAERLMPFGPPWAATSVEHVRHAFEGRPSGSLRPPFGSSESTPALERAATSLAPERHGTTARPRKGMKVAGAAVALLAVALLGSQAPSLLSSLDRSGAGPAGTMLTGLSSSNVSLAQHVQERTTLAAVTRGTASLGDTAWVTDVPAVAPEASEAPAKPTASAPVKRTPPASAPVQNLKSITLID